MKRQLYMCLLESLISLILISRSWLYRLEHLGDSVLGLCVTSLIREMYPRLRVGPATVSEQNLYLASDLLQLRLLVQKIRAIVVGNPTLAAMLAMFCMIRWQLSWMPVIVGSRLDPLTINYPPLCISIRHRLSLCELLLTSKVRQ